MKTLRQSIKIESTHWQVLVMKTLSCMETGCQHAVVVLLGVCGRYITHIRLWLGVDLI